MAAKPNPDELPIVAEMGCIWDDLGRALAALEKHGAGEYFDPHRKAERFRAALQDVRGGMGRLQALVQDLGELALATPGMIRDLAVSRAALNELLRRAGVNEAA